MALNFLCSIFRRRGRTRKPHSIFEVWFQASSQGFVGSKSSSCCINWIHWLESHLQVKLAPTVFLKVPPRWAPLNNMNMRTKKIIWPEQRLNNRPNVCNYCPAKVQALSIPLMIYNTTGSQLWEGIMKLMIHLAIKIHTTLGSAILVHCHTLIQTRHFQHLLYPKALAP